jgi:ribosomal protein S18 acetylase RimI-like enzyme
MTITNASKHHAPAIATLIMTAMTDDCCQFLAGPDHTLCDFRDMMTALVLMDDSQYSYRNALVALDDESANGDITVAPVAGVAVGYDGADLHRLRRRFQEESLRRLDMDHSHMLDETHAGEFYLDSLAVFPQYRRRGIAKLLLRATCERAAALGLPTALLVDKGNPDAERLYLSVGFRFVDATKWGGHEMKHLVCPIVNHIF